MRHYFEFDGMKSSDFGVFLSGAQTMGAAGRDVDEIVVPGRHGNLTIDNGRFNAISHVYPAFIAETAQPNLMGLRNALLSRRGSRRLSDTIHPDEFYRAYYEHGLEPEMTANLRHSEFEIEFTRDPRRFLVAGDTPVQIPEAEVETLSGGVVAYNDPSGIALLTITATGTEVTYCGKNIFDEDSADWKLNYYINTSGTESSNSSYKYSQAFIRVKPSTKYSVQIQKGSVQQLAVTVPFYDSAKGFLDRASVIPATRDTGMISGTFTTPADCHYIRLNVPKSYTTEVQVEYGEPTSYEQYNGVTEEYTSPISVMAHEGWNTIFADANDVSVDVSTPYSLNNPTLFASSPLIRVHGQGTVYAGGMGITVGGSFPYVDIDCEIADCYYGATNANSVVTISGDFPKFAPGPNYIRYTGFRAVEITPRWWRL